MSGIDSITDKLASASVEDEIEVDFSNRALKLDTEENASEIVKAIKNNPGMTTLRLEGNTIGVDAAKAIAKALEGQPQFKKALWRDMFTQRTEHEIPDALNFLSSGVLLSGAHLVVLDLSDNAFGPRGLKGIVTLLQSPPCFSLKELQLNNNGLGVTGAKMLAEALLQCLKNSRANKTPLNLKTFICGRNRLENEGSTALSAFLKEAGSLEHVSMPQNGIYHRGISALADAFAANQAIKHLNLEDNSLTEIGAEALAEHLPNLPNLEIINFGDCLLKNEGAKILAEALENSCPNLKELLLGFNEIRKDGAMEIIASVINKVHLKTLNLNGNQFGIEGCQQMEKMMQDIGKGENLVPLDEDEGDDLDDDEYDEENDGEADDDDYYNEEKEEKNGHLSDSDSSQGKGEGRRQNSIMHASPLSKSPVTLDEFLESPSADKLIRLQQGDMDIATKLQETTEWNDCFGFLMALSEAIQPGVEEVEVAAFYYTDLILSPVFRRVIEEEMWKFNNDFFVALGLIKGENKKLARVIDLSNMCVILEHAVRQNYFHPSTKELLQFFLSRPTKCPIANDKAKHALLRTLFTV